MAEKTKTMRVFEFTFVSSERLSIVLEPHHSARIGDGGFFFMQDGKVTNVNQANVLYVEQHEYEQAVKEPEPTVVTL